MLLARVPSRLVRPAPTLVRAVSGKSSPFAPPEPPAVRDQKQLSRREEMKARQDAMVKLLREKALREVAESAAGVRPAGITHALGADAPDPVKKLAELRDANKLLTQTKEEAGVHDESGGPAGTGSPRERARLKVRSPRACPHQALPATVPQHAECPMVVFCRDCHSSCVDPRSRSSRCRRPPPLRRRRADAFW